MNRAVFLARVSATFVLLTLCATQLAAQSGEDLRRPVDSIRHFRFIPSRSSLEVTGGFAGIEQKFFPLWHVRYRNAL